MSSSIEDLRREIIILQGCIQGAINILREIDGEYPETIAVALNEQSHRVSQQFKIAEKNCLTRKLPPDTK